MWARASPGPVPAATSPPLREALPRKTQSRARGERLGPGACTGSSGAWGDRCAPCRAGPGTLAPSVLGLCDPQEAQAGDCHSGSLSSQASFLPSLSRNISNLHNGDSVVLVFECSAGLKGTFGAWQGLQEFAVSHCCCHQCYQPAGPERVSSRFPAPPSAQPPEPPRPSPSSPALRLCSLDSSGHIESAQPQEYEPEGRR